VALARGGAPFREGNYGKAALQRLYDSAHKLESAHAALKEQTDKPRAGRVDLGSSPRSITPSARKMRPS